MEVDAAEAEGAREVRARRLELHREHLHRAVKQAAPVFAARELWAGGDLGGEGPRARWERCLAALGGLEPRQAAAVAAAGERRPGRLLVGVGAAAAAGPCRVPATAFPPVVLDVAQQMEAAKRELLARLLRGGAGDGGAALELKDGRAATLVESSAGRFSAFAAFHYIKEPPADHGVCCEVELCGARVAYLACSVSNQDAAVPVPYAPPHRQLTAATIDRLVVAPAARRLGLGSALLERAGEAFARSGWPVRIRTQSPAAKALFDASPCFALEGRLRPSELRCGVHKNRRRKMYVDLDDGTPAGAGRLSAPPPDAATAGPLDGESVARRLNALLNKITADSAPQLAGRFEAVGSGAAAAARDGTDRRLLRLAAETFASRAKRAPPGLAAVLAAAAADVARGAGPAFGEELRAALAEQHGGCRRALDSAGVGAAAEEFRAFAAAEARRHLAALGAFEGTLVRHGTLDPAEARHRGTAAFEDALAGATGNGTTPFSRTVADVRAESAAELGVTLAPGRGERDFWIYTYGLPVQNPHDKTRWRYAGGKNSAGAFARVE